MENNTVRVMSLNLRVAMKGIDGVNEFAFRSPKLEAMLEREAPDIICFQEALDRSLNWFRERFGDRYELLWCGRDKNYSGESVPVAYLRNSFRLISFQTLWLSDTPDKPGSFYNNADQSNFPRLMHILEMFSVSAKKPIRVINTHLDCDGSIAREKELAQIRPYLESCGYAGILSGDFNATPEFPELAAFDAQVKPLGWRDAAEGKGATFHAYGNVNPPMKIDYVYTNCAVADSWVVSDRPTDGVYYSDHMAVMAVIEC